MNLVQSILVCICMMLPVNLSQRSNEWRGIVPLHSTRADVERLLGSSGDPCRCIYKTENEVVYVEYASAPCKGYQHGLNAPTDNVLLITVSSKTEQRFSDLRIDESKYVKTYDDTFTAYYTNKEEGLRYEVSESGIVNSVSYLPSAQDRYLRCSGSPTKKSRRQLTRRP